MRLWKKTKKGEDCRKERKDPFSQSHFLNQEKIIKRKKRPSFPSISFLNLTQPLSTVVNSVDTSLYLPKPSQKQWKFLSAFWNWNQLFLIVDRYVLQLCIMNASYKDVLKSEDDIMKTLSKMISPQFVLQLT